MKLIQHIEEFIERQHFVLRLFFFPVLLALYVAKGIAFAIALLIHPPQKSFTAFAPLGKRGYQKSYTNHLALVRQFKIGFIATVIVTFLTPTIFAWFSSAQPAYAATCNINTDTTLNQSYIDTNSCGDINISGNAVITFTEAIDLGGATDYTLFINLGVTATFSGALTLSDTGDVLQVDGTITQAAGNTTGVNITAQTVTINSTGKIDTNLKGCAGGTSASKNGFGPDIADSDTDTNVLECIQAQGGYGELDRGGASHAGIGGRSNGTANSQDTTYGTVNAPITLGSGGAGGPNAGENGGAGGGVVRLDVAGTLTVNGPITANGGNSASTSSGAGGGAGGSIYVTAGTISGTSNITANGGNGFSNGGGGGGGRIAIFYNALSGYPIQNTIAAKGNKGASVNATDGGAGATFILNRKTDDGVGNLFITSGLDFQNGVDFTRANITAYNGASLRCNTFATLNLGASATLDFQGVTMSCLTVDTINLSAATWTTSNTNSMDVSKSGVLVDWDISNDLTLNNMTFTSGQPGTASASGGVITMDNVIDVSLVNSTINSSVNWTNLESLNIDSTSKINADGKGCIGGPSGTGTAADGYGPNTSTGICAQTTSGYGINARGGAAHAGTGGRSNLTNNPQNTTYGSSITPALFGSGGGGGGNAGEIGGNGGGYVRLDATGTVTVNGSISAAGKNGGAGSSGSGGGSGGSVHITTGTLAGSSTISAPGGNGANHGGGGSGGRVAVYYNTLTDFTLSNITAAKGTKGSQANATDGGAGTTYILDRKTDDGLGTLTISSGLDFISTGDYARTNITAYNGAVLTCGSFATLNFSATATINFQGVTWTCNSIDTINLSAATWTTSNTNVISFAKAGAVVDWNITSNLTLNNLTYTGATAGTSSATGGVLTLDNAIDISLVNTDINSSVKWEGVGNVTIDTDSSIAAGGTGCVGGPSGSGAAANGYGPNTSTGICAQTTSGYGINARGGAAHAGTGGRSNLTNNPQTVTYGSNTTPSHFGSGGGGGGNAGEAGGNGGGYVRLDATGTVTVNGPISASGKGGAAVSSGAGGGSGGSVHITTGTLAGSSTISAGGGDGFNHGGGGGGGRVAAYYDALSGFSLSNITATKGLKGSQASATDGTDGTVYTLQYSVPSTPSINSPAGGATNQSRNLSITGSTFSSDGRPHVSSAWQISDDNTFSDGSCADANIVWCNMTSTTNKESITVNATNGTFQNALSGRTKLAPNTTYYVRVRYTNSVGGSAWSPSISFTTLANGNPSTPTNSAPADAATGVSVNPTLSASSFSDPDSDSHGTSDWFVYENNNCSGTADWSKTADSSNLTSIVVNSTNGTFADALASQTRLRAHTVYSFKVKYIDIYSGSSAFSTCTSFTTTNTAPALDSSIPAQTFLEDNSVTGAFDLDTYFSDADFNDNDQYTCSASNGFAASLGTMTINGDRTVDFSLQANANGSDTIQFSCQDGGGLSTASNSITVTVTAVNDAPSFTKGSNQTVLEDAGAQTVTGWATSISKGPSDESGQTLTFNVSNDNNGLFSSQPSVNTSTGDLTFTPAANANGSTTVTISLSDNGGTVNSGADTSANQTFTITVTGVNDAPSYTKGSNQTVLEDAGAQTVASWATSMSKGPSDESGQTISFSASNDNNSLFSTQPSVNVSTGDLTYTPAVNANGSTTVTLTISDTGGTANGGTDSSSQTFTITVTAVNDAPSFTKGADQTVLEDAGAQTVVGWATSMSKGPNDESSQVLSFTVSNDNNGLFSAQPTLNASTGNLTYTPAAHANGSSTVTVSISDDGGTANGGSNTSSSQTFTLTITAVNDIPSFTKGGDKGVSENAGAQTFADWATSISAGASNESGQTLTFTVTSDNTALFSTQPAVSSTGTLTFTPATSANGSATVTVRLSDNGGTANGGADTSSAQTFLITVSGVNDAPSFTKGADRTVLEDAGAQSVTGWATNISAGPSDESSQIISFEVTAVTTSLFSTQPSVSSSGVLTFTPASNANGSTSVTIRARDDGGTSNGGSDTSASQTFTITVTAVNDIPSFVKGNDQTILEDAGAQTVTSWASSISKGPSNESTQTVSFTVSADNTSLFSTQPSIDSSTGNLTYTPAAHAFGSTTITVKLTDDGGTANGGADSTAAQTFTLTITALNDAPYFTKGADRTVSEDAGAQSVANWVTGISQGASNESSQTLTFTVTNTNTSLFSVQPSISSDGTLSYTPTANASGQATLSISLKDDGGIANGGSDTSTTQTATLTVSAVNDAPTFTGNLPAVTFFAGTTTSNVFDLDEYYSDIEGDALTYSVTGAESVGVTITDGAVSLSAPSSFAGLETLTFKATDVNGAVTASNSVAVNVAESDSTTPEVPVEDISHILGKSKGEGAIQVIGNDNTVLAQWVAFPVGGVIPRIAHVGDDYYVYAVKRRSGSTMHVYTLGGEIVAKRHLSTKLHWRRLAVGNLDDDTTDQEIVIATKRDSVIFMKAFSFNPKSNELELRATYVYGPIKSYDYVINISKRTVHVIGKKGKTLFDWHPLTNQ